MEIIKNKLNQFSENKLSSEFKIKSFHYATKKIMSKELIQLTKELINELNNFIKFKGIIIKPRILLVSYLIHYYRTELLIEENEEVFKKSIIIHDLIENYENNKKYICNLIKNLYEFKKIFKVWKEKDLTEQLSYYINLYFKYKELKKKFSNSKYLYFIDEMMAKSKKYAINYSSVDYFNSIEKEHNQLNESLQKILKNKIKECYWDLVQSSLEKNNDYKFVIDLLQNIKNLFTNIFVTIDKQHKKDYLDEYLDLNFIKQLIEKKAYTKEKLNQLLDLLLDLLLEIDSQIQDKENSSIKKKNLFIEKFKYLLLRLEYIILILKNKK